VGRNLVQKGATIRNVADTRKSDLLTTDEVEEEGVEEEGDAATITIIITAEGATAEITIEAEDSCDNAETAVAKISKSQCLSIRQVSVSLKPMLMKAEMGDPGKARRLP